MSSGRLRVVRAQPHNIKSFGNYLAENVSEISRVLEELFLLFLNKRITGQPGKVALDLFMDWCVNSGVVTFDTIKECTMKQLKSLILLRIGGGSIEESKLQLAIKELVEELGFDKETIRSYTFQLINNTIEKYNQINDIENALMDSYWNALSKLYEKNIEIFCIQTAHVIIARVLLYRVGEDKGLFPKRISQNSLKRYRSNKQLLTDSQSFISLIEQLRKEMQNLLPTVCENNEFDWWYLPTVYRNLSNEQLDFFNSFEMKLNSILSRLLEILDSFELGGIDKDIWKDVYQLYLNEETRRRLGGFYTPDELGTLILDIMGYTKNRNKLCKMAILDPACGSGTFLVDSAVRLISHLEDDKMSCHTEIHRTSVPAWMRNKTILDILAQNICGNDVHPFAQFLTMVNLFFLSLSYFTYVRRYAPSYRLDFRIGCFDSLKTDIGVPSLETFSNSRLQTAQMRNKRKSDLIKEEFDFVVGNPPWGGVLKGKLSPLFDDEKRKSYKKHYKDSATGKYDIYVLFFERGIRWLKDGARLGFVTQNVFPNKDYGQGIRKFISSYCSLDFFIDIGDIGRIFFPDAMNTPAVTILNKNTVQKDIILCKMSSTATKLQGDLIEKRKKIGKMIIQSINRVRNKSVVSNNFVMACSLPPQTIEKGGSNQWVLHPLYPLKEKIKLDNPISLRSLLKISQGVTIGGLGAFDVYILNSNCKKILNLEKEIVRPVIQPREIERWRYTWKGYWIIYPYLESEGTFIPAFRLSNKFLKHGIEDALDFKGFSRDRMNAEFQKRRAQGSIRFPNVAQHLFNNYDILSTRVFEGKQFTDYKIWYEFHRERDPHLMLSKEKIITPRLTDTMKFAYAHDSYIILDYCFSMVPSHKDDWKELQSRLSVVTGSEISEKDCICYILGIINSEIGNFMLKLGRPPTPKKDYSLDYHVFEDLRIPLPKHGQENKVRREFETVSRKHCQ